MIDRFVDAILQRAPASRSASVFWALFLLLGPAAYVAGSYLEQHGMGRMFSGVTLDRDSAIATARQFAASRSLETAGWKAYTTIEPSKDLLEYYRIHRDAAGAAAQSLAPAAAIRVLLASPKDDTLMIFLDGMGRVTGYEFTRVKALTGGAPLKPDDAIVVARASLDRLPNISTFSLGKPTVSPDKTKGCTSFGWTATSGALPGLTVNINSTVCGSSVVRQLVTASVSSGYARKHWARAEKPLNILLVIYGIYITVVLIYSIYRYARRAMEREVSHFRTLLVALLVGGALMANFLNAFDEYAFGMVFSGQGIVWFPLVAVFLSFLVMGLGIAVAYGAGEGDVREFYPGKLTSLDAVMSGRFINRNVGRSVLFGVAYGAWMLLLEGTADAFLHPNSGAFTAEVMKFPFFRYPLLTMFVGQAVSVTLMPATGLLLPLAFLGRNVRRPRLRAGLMVLLAIVGSLLNVGKSGSLPSAMLSVAIIAATLLGPFFAMDLLAVLIGLGAFQVAMSMSRLAVLSSSWLEMGVAVGVIGLGVLVVEAWAVLRGREYREDEVRPVYAGNMVERQAMQAELAAAREAQLHLLPKSAPPVDGLTISASCIPARIVGGDFYDFYPLGDGRLGIFIAEGGNRGIGSALNIALAKGFLMHTVRRNLSPREIVQRLESAIGPLLAGAGATTHVAYAVIDTVAGSLRYARTGDYPRVVVGGLASEEKFDVAGAPAAVYEGAATLRAGDTVLLFTDGIAHRVRTTGPKAADNILKALARKRRENDLEDDLTAVVVKITGIAAMEVVA